MEFGEGTHAGGVREGGSEEAEETSKRRGPLSEQQRPSLSDDGLEVSLPFRRLRPSSSSNNPRRWIV
jgi:hypothetical protein